MSEKVGKVLAGMFAYYCFSYLVVLVLEFDIAVVHGVENDSHRLDDVVEYYGLPFELLAFGEALRIDQPHLLENRRLARFSGTCASANMISYLCDALLVGCLRLGQLSLRDETSCRSIGTETTTKVRIDTVHPKDCKKGK